MINVRSWQAKELEMAESMGDEMEGASSRTTSSLIDSLHVVIITCIH